MEKKINFWGQDYDLITFGIGIGLIVLGILILTVLMIFLIKKRKKIKGIKKK